MLEVLHVYLYQFHVNEKLHVGSIPFHELRRRFQVAFALC